MSRYKVGINMYDHAHKLPNVGDPKDINHPGSGFGSTVAAVDVNGDG